MQYSYSALALVALFTSVQAVTLPACAQTCITAAVAAVTTCGATDYACICTTANQGLITTKATPCVLANCTPAEISTTLADEPNVCPDLLASATKSTPPATSAPAPVTSSAPAPVTSASAPVTSASAETTSSAPVSSAVSTLSSVASSAPASVVTSASPTVSGKPTNATSSYTTAFTGAAATAGAGYLPVMLLGAAALAAL